MSKVASADSVHISESDPVALLLLYTSMQASEPLHVQVATQEGTYICRLLNEMKVTLDGSRIHIECDNQQTSRLINDETAKLRTKFALSYAFGSGDLSCERLRGQMNIGYGRLYAYADCKIALLVEMVPEYVVWPVEPGETAAAEGRKCIGNVSATVLDSWTAAKYR